MASLVRQNQQRLIRHRKLIAPNLPTKASGTGTATGAATAPGIGQALWSNVGTATGTATAPGIGAALWSNVGTANGTATAPGVGASTNSGVGSATGAATAPGIGAALWKNVGTATGLGAAPGIGADADAVVGTANGVATAPGIGQSRVDVVGTATGLGAAPGISQPAVTSGTGAATGLGTAPGIGQSQVDVIALAAGVALAPAIGVAISGAKKVGWPRRIPVERLREILKAQGNPWADELGDVVEAATPKSPRHQEAIETAVDEIVVRAAQPVDWGLVVGSMRASASAKRATLAIKHADAALTALRARLDQENDDEEAIVLLMYG